MMNQHNAINEIWKDIPSHPTYQASNLGRIRNKETYQIRNKVMTPAMCKKGYLKTVIDRVGVKVHRMVAEAFIPNPENKPQVNHINGIKNDNRVENLEWVSNRENIIHAYKNKLLVSKSGDEFHRTKHSDEFVLKIYNEWKSGVSKREIARKYKVDRNIFKRKILCNL